MNIAITERRKHIPTQSCIQFTFVHVPADLQLNFPVSVAEFYIEIRGTFEE